MDNKLVEDCINSTANAQREPYERKNGFRTMSARHRSSITPGFVFDNDRKVIYKELWRLKFIKGSTA